MKEKLFSIFFLWCIQAEDELQDHKHLPVAVQLSHEQGELNSGTATEYHQLKNGIIACDDLASLYGLNALNRSFVPGGTKKKVINHLHKWVFNKHDVLGSSWHSLDDLCLAGI